MNLTDLIFFNKAKQHRCFSNQMVQSEKQLDFRDKLAKNILTWVFPAHRDLLWGIIQFNPYTYWALRYAVPGYMPSILIT